MLYYPLCGRESVLVLLATLARRLARLATTTTDRGGGGRVVRRGERTALDRVRLLRLPEDRLEGLALVRLHRLLHVGEPLVTLTANGCSRIGHFYLTHEKESTGTLEVEIPMTSKGERLVRIRVYRF
jgi:hypothetical protein